VSPADLFILPHAIPVLLIAPGAWLTLYLLDRARTRRLMRLVGPRVKALAADLSLRHRFLRRALFSTGLLLALLAVPQPSWGEDTRATLRRGVDLLLCLDVSRSMLARDLLPSRLARARREIRELAERARGDRLGLLVFAGEARLKVPFTNDLGSFADLVDPVDPLSVRRGGTDLGAALECALGVLERESGDHKVLILISDGEDFGERGLRVAQICRQKNLSVHCMGVGSPLGSKIALEGESGEEFLRDRSGAEVVSAMDPVSLKRIAETTGGVFVDAGAEPRPLVRLYEERILPIARKAFETEERRERPNRYQWPLLGAFLLWMLELSLTDRSRR